jgi:hypothetical protein
MMLGSLSDTAMSSIRPPMLAGPIDRNLKLASRGLDYRMTITVSRRFTFPWALQSAEMINAKISMQHGTLNFTKNSSLGGFRMCSPSAWGARSP